jgi:hypothetical protein
VLRIQYKYLEENSTSLLNHRIFYFTMFSKYSFSPAG